MFKSRLRLEATEPGEWALIRDMEWDGAGFRVIVPKGFITDLASIPRIFRAMFDRNGLSRRPAVLHDWLYCSQKYSRSTADWLFLQALKAEGVGLLTRQAMYAGVRAGGWIYYGRRKDGLNHDDFKADL